MNYLMRKIDRMARERATFIAMHTLWLWRICRYMLIVGLLLSQIACSNQENEIATLVQTIKVSKPPMQVAWRPDGKHFAVVGFGGLTVWDITAGKQESTPSMWAVESSVAYSPNGKFLVLHKAVEGHQGKSALVWLDANDNHLIREYFNEYALLIPGMAFSPDSHLLVVGGDKYNGYLNVATVFDVATGKIVAKLKTIHTDTSAKGEDFIQRVVYSPDGTTIIIGFISGKIDVWSTQNWHLLKTFKAHKGSILAMAISPNGKWLATGTNSGGARGLYAPSTKTTIETQYDDPIKIWDTSSWRQIGALPIIDKHTSSLAFLPNGKNLVSANEDRILFWDVQAEKQVGVINGEFKGGSALNFALSTDGNYLAVVGVGFLTAQVWKISDQLNNGEK